MGPTAGIRVGENHRADGRFSVVGTNVRGMRRASPCGVRPCLAVAFLCFAACGGGEEKPPGVPPPSGDGPEEAADPGWDTGGPPASEGVAPEPAAVPSESGGEAERKEPEFAAGMSVNEAIAAVPSHYDYVGIDQEVLAKPLLSMDTYKECKVSQGHRFKVRIAVWDGRVVGADVDAKGNKKLAECIDGVVRKLEYKEKVKSINTVEFEF